MTVSDSLYERFPYPAPSARSDLISDTAYALSLALHDGELRRWRMLDAGCGTGHRLVALAAQYPEATFVGLDASAASLAVARELADKHEVSNVEFVQGDLGSPEVSGQFDLIVCSGVLHHLPDPAAALRGLTARLSPDGLVYLWLYHEMGEYHRMLEHRLVSMFGAGDEGPDLAVVRALGLSVSPTRYGGQPGAAELEPRDHDVLDADTYLNPIVRPLRFATAAELCLDAGLSWVSALGVTGDGQAGLLDLSGAAELPFFRKPEQYFPEPALRSRMGDWDTGRTLEAVELRLRPTGFSVLAGQGTAAGECEPWVRGNVFAGRIGPGTVALGQLAGDRRRRRFVRRELAAPLRQVRANVVRQYGDEAMHRVTAAIDMAIGDAPRTLTDPRQRPALFHLPGLPAEPWVAPQEHPELHRFAAALEEHWETVRAEVDELGRSRGGLDGYLVGEYMTAKFNEPGDRAWLSTTLFADGAVPADVRDTCPVTAGILDAHAALLSGDVIVSRVGPGAVLAPHVDDNDYKLTLHLGLRVPAGCAMRVGTQTRSWQEGRCLAFSDAYEHEVWNRSEAAREIVLADIWHPQLSTEERAALRAVRDVLQPACEPAVFDRY
ncbi:aspartyl/asparaginyl beta-hydroxylase domain-containing protein [Dactylosporangium sp. NPDC051484]|uniref:aspartyl/asparaginyl beta-hydroxylase domain-containing protein n=1 Tax=Dactylosporangium sp. NPDC051484 TaxID=3154942 RepID=UPI0034501ED1